MGTVKGTDGKARTARAFPTVVPVYVGALFALAAAIGATGGELRPAAEPSIAIAAVTLGLLVAAGHLVLMFRFREQSMALDMLEAMLAVALVALPVPTVVALAGAATLIADRINRVPLLKAAFNSAQWACAAGIGGLVLHEMGGLRDADRAIPALVAAMGAMALFNTIAFAAVIRLAQGERLPQVLRVHTPTILVGWLINTAFGVLFVGAFEWRTWALPFLAVPLVLLHFAYRGHATAVADKARLDGLHRASRTLARPMDLQEAIPRFVDTVRSAFGYEVVDLVLTHADERIVHRTDGTYQTWIEPAEEATLASTLSARTTAVRLGHERIDADLDALLHAEGWRDCIAAPLVDEGRPIGVLCAYNRTGLEGFEDGEMSVLTAIASEAAATVRKGVLVDQIIEERRKLADVIENTTDGIMMLDEAGVVSMWNPGLEAITGYRSSEMVGRRMFAGLLPRDADGEVIHLENGVSPDVTMPVDMQIITATGDTRWLSCSYTRVPQAEGRAPALIVIARDVTRSRELDRLKEDFVATVSHELRTPLTPIKGWASTLIDAGDRLGPEEREAAARSILRQAEGLERLIVNLLEVSKIERGVIDLRDAVVDVKGVVTRVVAEAAQQYPARAVRIDVGSGLCRARGDEGWVERIISNLVSNAMKYSPADEAITIGISEEPGQIVVSVSDNGPGIPAHETERIFERFQRLGNHMTRATGGTGLGLYIARQLAQALGGALTVSSEVGHGATFTLSLRATERRLVAVG